MVGKKNLFVKNFGLLIVVALSIIPLFDLLTPGLPVTHDGMDHVARIANFYHSLSEGNIIPRWAEYLNWGYGHPILMFLYPFSSYSASLFHFLGFTYVDSLKLVFAAGFIGSGIAMYLWMREQFDNIIGIAAAAFYLYAPYRFVDMYVRGAIGEHMAFVFPPLILFFILKFYKAKSVWNQYLFLVGVAVSFAALLLSHNAISLMVIPVIGFYVLWHLVKGRDIRKLGLVVAFLTLGLMLSSFFVMPAFLEGKYTLRDKVIGQEYATRFVENPIAFIYGTWNYGISGQFTVQLGLIHLIGLLFLPVVFVKKLKKADRYLALGLFAFFAVSIFLQLSISNFVYNFLTILKNFQFPWRFLSLSLFSLSIVAPLILLLFKNSHARIALTLLIIGLLLTTHSFWKAKDYKIVDDAFYEKNYHGTTDTGESAPIWSVRFMEKEPKARIEIIEGTASIDELHRTSTMHSYKIDVNSSNAKFRENTLYFPGWKVFANKVPQEVQFQDQGSHGLQLFTLPQGNHLVEVIFEDTKLRMLANAVSLFSFIFLIGLGLCLRFYLKSARNK